jgi:hypothetical protein
MVKDLYVNYEAKANFLDEIAENRDEYFRRMCSRVVEEMNLPLKLKNLLRNELKPEIMKETLSNVDDKMKMTGEEMANQLTSKISEVKEDTFKTLGMHE